jgi:hypothetical protein
MGEIMPGTKRVPLARPHASSLQQVLPLFQRALEARKRWRRDRNNDEKYAAYIEAQRAVNRALGTKLWEVSIWDLDDVYSRSKPTEMERDRDSWARALELRQALEAFDQEQRQQQRATVQQRTETVQPSSSPEEEEPTAPPPSP